MADGVALGPDHLDESSRRWGANLGRLDVTFRGPEVERASISVEAPLPGLIQVLQHILYIEAVPGENVSGRSQRVAGRADDPRQANGAFVEVHLLDGDDIAEPALAGNDEDLALLGFRPTMGEHVWLVAERHWLLDDATE